MLVRLRWSLVGLACVAACAGGAEDASTSFDAASDTASAGTSSTGFNTSSISAEGSSASGSGSSGETDETTTGVLPGSSSGQSSDSESTSTTGPYSGSSSSSSSSGGESSSSGGESSSSSSSSSTGGALCVNELVCPMASNEGTLSGDTGGVAPNTITLTGDAPTWVTFTVTEDDNEILPGRMLSFTATLTSPVGHDYDLFVYRRPIADGSGCEGLLDSSEGVGATDIVYSIWGEGLIPNNLDDAAWIAIEVRPKNDVCDPGAEWTLVLEGDT